MKKLNGRLFFAMIAVFFSMPVMGTEMQPGWFLSFRDVVYEQVLSTSQVLQIYRETKQRAEETFTGYQLYTLLSRCEYTMGHAFQFLGKNDEASSFYEQGIEWAKKSLSEKPTPEGYEMLAVNIAIMCGIKPVSYVLANGPKSIRYAKDALALDPQNKAAHYLIGAQYVHPPAPFCNVQKGLSLLEELSANYERGIPEADKDICFNLYSSLALAYNKLKMPDEARFWLEKTNAIYPAVNYMDKSLITLL
jgi:tetratricopeptide (TPR) repeat protein